MAHGANFGFCVFCITHHIWCFKMISSKNAKMNTINRTINSKPPSTFPRGHNIYKCSRIFGPACLFEYSFERMQACAKRVGNCIFLAMQNYIFITTLQGRVWASCRNIHHTTSSTGWIFHDKTKRSHQQHCRAECRDIHRTTSRGRGWEPSKKFLQSCKSTINLLSRSSNIEVLK